MNKITITIFAFALSLTSIFTSCSNSESKKSETVDKKSEKSVKINSKFTSAEKTSPSKNFTLTDNKVAISGAKDEMYGEANWSPNGKYLAYSSVSTKGIYVKDAKSGKTKELVNDLDAGYGYSWSADGEYILFKGTRIKEGRKEYIATVNVETGKKEILVDRGNRRESTPFWDNTEEGKKVVYLDGDKPKVAKEYKYADDYTFNSEQPNTRNVILAGNNTYVFEGTEQVFVTQKTILGASVSPDNTMMVYTIGGKGMMMYNFNTKTELPMGRGIHASWSPDSKYIVYQISDDNGEEYTGSELYVSSVDGKYKKQITKTMNILEFKPTWSANGKNISYQDGETGTIYTTTLKN